MIPHLCHHYYYQWCLCTSVVSVPQHGCGGQRRVSCDQCSPIPTWAPEAVVRLSDSHGQYLRLLSQFSGFFFSMEILSYVCTHGVFICIRVYAHLLQTRLEDEKRICRSLFSQPIRGSQVRISGSQTSPKPSPTEPSWCLLTYTIKWSIWGLEREFSG